MWDVIRNNQSSPRTSIVHNIFETQAGIRLGDYKLLKNAGEVIIDFSRDIKVFVVQLNSPLL